MNTDSKLTRSQKITMGPRGITYYNRLAWITVVVRHDDECGNGYNSFSVTAEIKIQGRVEACGCLHDKAVRAFPELAPLVQWHLCSTDGPLHYIENTMFWLGRRGYTAHDNARAGRPSDPNDPPNLAYARKSAVWPDMPENFVITGTTISNADVEAALRDRLPALMAEFRAAVESLGLVW